MAGDRRRAGHHGGIYPGYVLVLAAVPAICQHQTDRVRYSVPFLGTMHRRRICPQHGDPCFVGTLLSTFVVDRQCVVPTFGGQKDSVQALKVVAHSYRFRAGIAILLPFVGS
jgi:hypothetical protein